MNLINKYRHLLGSATVRQSLITVTSTITNGLLAAVFYLLVARVVGPKEYGLFSLAAVSVGLMTVVFDFGNDRGMIKFLSGGKPGSEHHQKILKSVLLIKLCSSIFFIIAFSLFSKQIAISVFNQPEMSRYLPLTAVAFAAQLLMYFVLYYFQASEKFILWGFTLVGANFIRLLLAFTLAYLGWLNAGTTIFIFALTPALSFLVGASYIGWSFLNSRLDRATFSEIFSFNKWAMGFSAVSTISSRLDTFLTSYYSDLSNVGVYGLATQSILIMPSLVSALGAVTSPKFSRFKDHGENHQYLLKSLLFFTAIGAASGLILLPLGYLFMIISGPGYIQGFLPFTVLVFAQVLFLAVTPIRDSLLYYYSRADFFFWISLLNGTMTLLVGYLLIPKIGLMGAALSNLTGQLVLNLFSILFYRHIQARPLNGKHA